MSGNETKDVYSGQFSSKLRLELEQLTGSINDIMKNMRKMQNHILEYSEQMPVANEQLDKITAQTEQATGLGRTTIDKLMRDVTLVRKKVGRRTPITVESIERLVGAKVA